MQKQEPGKCSIPALKHENQWIHDNVGKADVFVDVFASKCVLPAVEVNEYSALPVKVSRQDYVQEPLLQDVLGRLMKLDEASATGPDGVSARLLKRCARAIAVALHKLACRILSTGSWPEQWIEHWIAPLYKRKSIWQAQNYRGIHITAQVSKVIERVLSQCFVPYSICACLYGEDQFAYTPKRGARDALALMSMQWLQALIVDVE